jgi:hypothetical protein
MKTSDLKLSTSFCSIGSLLFALVEEWYYTECLVTLCQYFKLLFLRSFPVRNVSWKYIQFLLVMELQIFEIQDDLNIRVIHALYSIETSVL